MSRRPSIPIFEAWEVFTPQERAKALARFWSKVDRSGDCWLWTGAKNVGYGMFGFCGKTVLAHRFAYETTVGKIPEGLEIDHLCRNRSCIRPTHLEVVTGAENTRRGESFAAKFRRRSRCARGHEFGTRMVYGRPVRFCPECRKFWAEARRNKRAA